MAKNMTNVHYRIYFLTVNVKKQVRTRTKEGGREEEEEKIYLRDDKEVESTDARNILGVKYECKGRIYLPVKYLGF